MYSLEDVLLTCAALLADEDEILAAIADQISNFPEFVGAENAVSLLSLLEVLN